MNTIEITELETDFFRYVKGILYSWITYNYRRVDLIIRAFGGEGKKGSLDNDFLTPKRKEDMLFTFSDPRCDDFLRREQIKEFQEGKYFPKKPMSIVPIKFINK